MGHVERDVGITNYNPGGFALTLLRKRVNSVALDVSMIRSPFADQTPAMWRICPTAGRAWRRPGS